MTSNMSLPSPRTVAELSSPSDCNKVASNGSIKQSGSPSQTQGSPTCSRMNASNPDTPVSASQSPSPSTRKDSSQSGMEFSNKGK